MAQWHGISRRKPSGGRRVRARVSVLQKYQREATSAYWRIKKKIYRRTGGNTLVRVLAADKVSINNPKLEKLLWEQLRMW